MTSNEQRLRVESHRNALQYLLRRLLPQLRFTPVRIALMYTIFGGFMLFISDVLFVRYFSEPFLSQLQALKGGVEVLLTAGIIFALTSRQEMQLKRSKDRIKLQREELDVLHRVLRHNLRNELNVVRGYAELIREQLSADELNEECSKILATVDELIQHTEQAKRIKQITQANGKIHTHDLSKLIPQLLSDHPLLSNASDVSTKLPDRAIVETNRMFVDALSELLTNAIKHNDSESSQIRIEVNPDNGPLHLVEILIIDNGPGIPPSELMVMESGTEKDLNHLSGEGLWFVEWTVRHSGGEFKIKETGQTGTTAAVYVPKSPEMLPSLLSSFLK